MTPKVQLNANGSYTLQNVDQISLEQLVGIRTTLDNTIRQTRFWRTNWSSFTTEFLNIDTWGGREVGVVEFDFKPFINQRILTRVENGILEEGDELFLMNVIRDEIKTAWEHPTNIYNPLGSLHNLVFQEKTLNLDWSVTSPPSVPKFKPLPGLRISHDSSYTAPTLPELSEIERFVRFAYYMFLKPVLIRVNTEYQLNLVAP